MTAPSSPPAGLHIPVMVREVIHYLNVTPGGIYLDGTLGSGGHATAIHSLLSPQGKLVGFDRDEEALRLCQSVFPPSPPLPSLHHASYADFPAVLAGEGLTRVNGMLLDLGLSSRQLDSPERGFSYRGAGYLDMRFDAATGRTAAELIRTATESELADILHHYGEERQSRRIARSIKRRPVMQTVGDLVEAVRLATPPAHRHRTLARVFQALRIAVNDELRLLESFLQHFQDYLLEGGRLVVISYHSLEDRLVKTRLRELARTRQIHLLTRKPVTPQPAEIAGNSRARSARLRAAERIAP